MTAPLFEDLDRVVCRSDVGPWETLTQLLMHMSAGGSTLSRIAEEIEWVAGVRVPEPVVGDWLRQLGPQGWRP